MTDKPYAGATPEQLEHPLVRELLNIHNLFRDELAVMLQYVNELVEGQQTLAGDQTTVRVRALIQAGIQYSQMLHMHHQIETSHMFPELEKKGLEGGVIERLNAEHDEIAALIDKFSRSISGLSAIDPAVMNSRLGRLAQALQEHLAYEETHICPFLARLSY